MDKTLTVTLIGVLAANLWTLVKVVRAIGRWEERFNLIWSWYLENNPPSVFYHRRRTDSARPSHAHDDAQGR